MIWKWWISRDDVNEFALALVVSLVFLLALVVLL